jgi:hypothetical protein
MITSAIKLGKTTISAHNDDFAPGIQIGYLTFHTECAAVPLSNADIYLCCLINLAHMPISAREGVRDSVYKQKRTMDM